MVIDLDARIQQPEITNQPGPFVRFSYQKGRRAEWNIRFRWFFNNAKLHQFGDFLTHEDAFVFRWLICLSKEVVSVGFQLDVINKFATFSQFTPVDWGILKVVVGNKEVTAMDMQSPARFARHHFILARKNNAIGTRKYRCSSFSILQFDRCLVAKRV